MLEKMRNEVKMARREHDFAWQKVCNAQSLLDMIISSTHNDYEFEAALAEVVNSHSIRMPVRNMKPLAMNTLKC